MIGGVPDLLDLSDDYKLFDGLEVVNYEVALRGENEPDAVLQAKRRAISNPERYPSGGVYVGASVDWHVPDPLLIPGVTPKPADVIVDSDGQRWTVLIAEHKALQSRWRLTCVNLILAYQLRDQITIERPDITPDSSGVVVKKFPTVPSFPRDTQHVETTGGKIIYRGIARVQLLAEAISEGRGIRGPELRYDVIVPHLPVEGLTTEDRIVWLRPGKEFPNTVYLDCLGYRNAARIDELPVIEAVRKAA